MVLWGLGTPAVSSHRVSITCLLRPEAKSLIAVFCSICLSFSNCAWRISYFYNVKTNNFSKMKRKVYSLILKTMEAALAQPALGKMCSHGSLPRPKGPSKAWLTARASGCWQERWWEVCWFSYYRAYQFQPVILLSSGSPLFLPLSVFILIKWPKEIQPLISVKKNHLSILLIKPGVCAWSNNQLRDEEFY